ncbi:DUF4183 domain-containing protein [Bacillus sp. RAR_GA_16]|uniref:DUF4183 domain-containing protein n=1 Tax=Bacillus sp. RAR_GA_16 TaxID=2876774 RepID=UPI001CD00115|nr:DUF4183 domain-containing protein [Bacillus sp. RAR_GA_16]MCA0174225.1 DUF4183 domain-containing protein [Bacillus sp. RAR_GA_16]
MNKQNWINETEVKLPDVTFPKLRKQITKTKVPKKVCVYEYFALAKKDQKIFTDRDAVKGYCQQNILSPSDVSYINLFINGVLQPEMNYFVKEGMLVILTEDAPITGAAVSLQMIVV